MSNQVTDKNGNLVDRYRFQTGSLFEFDVHAGAYIHCYRNRRHTTKRAAIKAYEEIW